jgi:hypothetical protein
MMKSVDTIASKREIYDILHDVIIKLHEWIKDGMLIQYIFIFLLLTFKKKDLTPRFIIDGTKVRDQENVKLHEL